MSDLIVILILILGIIVCVGGTILYVSIETKKLLRKMDSTQKILQRDEHTAKEKD